MALAALKKKKIVEDLKQMETGAGRAGADTLRLWEHYREQALLWRALALLQMPATFLSVFAALIMFFFADTIIEVPQTPLPGRYAVKQLPDKQFVDFATELVNLIATYTPAVATKQFERAEKLLWEPALTDFATKYRVDQIREIVETRRTQIFFVNEFVTKVERLENEDMVIVRLQGVRSRIVQKRPVGEEEVSYYVKMAVIPRNVENPYGIVAVDLRTIIETSNKVLLEDKQKAYEEAIRGNRQ